MDTEVDLSRKILRNGTNGAMYSRMDLVNFVEDSL